MCGNVNGQLAFSPALIRHANNNKNNFHAMCCRKKCLCTSRETDMCTTLRLRWLVNTTLWKVYARHERTRNPLPFKRIQCLLLNILAYFLCFIRCCNMPIKLVYYLINNDDDNANGKNYPALTRFLVYTKFCNYDQIVMYSCSQTVGKEYYRKLCQR